MPPKASGVVDGASKPSQDVPEETMIFARASISEDFEEIIKVYKSPCFSTMDDLMNSDMEMKSNAVEVGKCAVEDDSSLKVKVGSEIGHLIIPEEFAKEYNEREELIIFLLSEVENLKRVVRRYMILNAIKDRRIAELNLRLNEKGQSRKQ